MAIHSIHSLEKNREYKPAVLKKEDPMHRFLLHFGKLLHMSLQERKIITQMWGDFYALRPVVCFSDEDYMIWTLAVLENFMKITKTYLLDVVTYAEKIHIDMKRVEERTGIVQDVLQLKEFDCRYMSEDAFMNMTFS